MAIQPRAVVATDLAWPANMAIQMRQPDVDAAPPRTNIPS